MTVPVRRQNHGLLPDLMDWAESFPPLVGFRPLSALQGIRIEDFVKDGHYVIRAELPGIDPDKDVTLTVADRSVTISAERKEETEDGYRSEFRYGSFTRTITLPGEAKTDSVKADYAKGILTVTIDLDKKKNTERKIPIEHKK